MIISSRLLAGLMWTHRCAGGCLTVWSSKIGRVTLLPGYDSIYGGVEQQLDILGADHVGYAQKHFMSSSGAPFAIVGARPFSKVTTASEILKDAHPHLRPASVPGVLSNQDHTALSYGSFTSDMHALSCHVHLHLAMIVDPGASIHSLLATFCGSGLLSRCAPRHDR